MNVLVTGNSGYIGPILAKMLNEKSYNVIGYDTDYYDGCDLWEFKKVKRQIKKELGHMIH